MISGFVDYVDLLSVRHSGRASVKIRNIALSPRPVLSALVLVNDPFVLVFFNETIIMIIVD